MVVDRPPRLRRNFGSRWIASRDRRRPLVRFDLRCRHRGRWMIAIPKMAGHQPRGSTPSVGETSEVATSVHIATDAIEPIAGSGPISRPPLTRRPSVRMVSPDAEGHICQGCGIGSLLPIRAGGAIVDRIDPPPAAFFACMLAAPTAARYRLRPPGYYEASSRRSRRVSP